MRNVILKLRQLWFEAESKTLIEWFTTKNGREPSSEEKVKLMASRQKEIKRLFGLIR